VSCVNANNVFEDIEVTGKTIGTVANTECTINLAQSGSSGSGSSGSGSSGPDDDSGFLTNIKETMFDKGLTNKEGTPSSLGYIILAIVILIVGGLIWYFVL